MKVAYVDTSALVAIAFDEPMGTAMAVALEEFDAWIASNLLEAELRATFLREERSEGLEDLLASVSWILPDRSLEKEMQGILEHGYLRGADLWHLACAVFLAGGSSELSFVTLDQRQRAVAERVGFRVIGGGTSPRA